MNEEDYTYAISCAQWRADQEEEVKKTSPLRANPDTPLFTFPEELGEPSMKDIKWGRLLVALAVCSALIGVAYVMQ